MTNSPLFSYVHRLPGSGTGSLSELTFLQASRRAAAAVHPQHVPGSGAGGSGGGGVAGVPPPHGAADFHPAYRLHPYMMEHLYGSLNAVAAAAAGSPGSPAASSLRGLSPLDSRGESSEAFSLVF